MKRKYSNVKDQVNKRLQRQEPNARMMLRGGNEHAKRYHCDGNEHIKRNKEVEKYQGKLK